ISSNKIDQHATFCIFALGKLGAIELNYSSDVDLIFVCVNEDEINGDIHEYQAGTIDHIRKLSNILEETTEDGFLYRVDLKLRPWGRSGPLVLSVDDTEHYYEASTEAWERFAWLRARKIAGDESLGSELLERLQPFIFHQSLGSDDLERFIQIKNDMAAIRKRAEYWNVKLGEGGIRDIEFFIQILQIVNAYRFQELQTTHTLSVLQALIKVGLIQAEDGQAIHNSYLFLRRLENRLQMIDEKQTHELPDDSELRLKIARSLGYGSNNDEETLERFDEHLNQCRGIASSCFERILPGELSL
ncbi:MAG: bifunctional glutamine synthetase adenylyltransferase/deadenyltransferase, partial [Gammaproteobacteria bacterium]